MIRGIIFDCFGVLYVDSSHHFYQQYVPNYDELRTELWSLNRASDYGLLSQAELNQAVADLTGLGLPFVSEHVQGVSQRNDELLKYAQQLRKDYKIGMLSNIGPGSMDKFFSAEDRRTLFDGVVLSGEEGMTKPHPLIFELAAQRLGLTPGECIMIDDLAENCAGADAAGMQSIVYRSNKQVEAEIQRITREQNA